MSEASQPVVVTKARPDQVLDMMAASLKIFVLWWAVVAGAVSLADNENIGEPRNGMLGIYFNPQGKQPDIDKLFN